MKSSVENYLDYRQIPVPEELLTIEIPSWEDVAKPMVESVLKQFQIQFESLEEHLTDEMVQALKIPNIQTVHQVKQYGMDVYINNLSFVTYHEKVLPWILSFYRENTNTIMDRSEKEAYIEEYLEQVKVYARQNELSLKDYAAKILKITSKPIETLTERALEDFTFKLIAQAEFARKGIVLDELAYEEFIQTNVLHKQIDEIDLREAYSFEKFKQMMPEMNFSEEIKAHYIPKFKVKINPLAELRHFG